MGENSKIEWTHHTFNPWWGCTKIAPGCTHCYADTFAKRTGKAEWGDNGTRLLTGPANWAKPLKWDKAAAAAGERHRVFCASMADVFEDWGGPMRGPKGGYLHHGKPWGSKEKFIEIEDMAIGKSIVTMNDVRRELFALIDATPNLDWLLLTKRPENIYRFWQSTPSKMHSSKKKDWHRSNVWLGTSISDQATADKNIPELLKCRALAPVLFLSAEPLLGPVEFSNVTHRVDAVRVWGKKAMAGIDWVIAGGESGHHARPMHPDWARGLRDQCTAAGVPFFFKQHGEWMPVFHGIDPSANDPKCRVHQGFTFDDKQIMWRVGKKAAGRKLDGKTWSQFPEAKPCRAT